MEPLRYIIYMIRVKQICISLQQLRIKKHYNGLLDSTDTMNELKWQDVVFTDIPYVSTGPPRFLQVYLSLQGLGQVYHK